MEQQKTGKSWLIALIIVAVLCALVVCLVAGCLGARLLSQLDLGPGTRSFVDPSHEVAGRTAQTNVGALRLVGGAPVTLDPALVEDSTSAEYVDKIFAGLVSLDKDLQVRPELAEGWDIHPDGTVYTFRLRDEVRFQDGRPVTAADVKYSLERACDPELGSNSASLYLGDIVGVEERLAGKADEVRGVRVLDDRTVQITIDAPKAYFLAKLTYPTGAVVDQADVESRVDWLDDPNGTGPYRLASHTSEAIELEASDHYWRGKPAIREVRFDLVAGDPVTMYENGELDVTPVGLGAIERVQDPANSLHDELTAVSSLNVQYVGLNTRLAPFDDTKVRQAFAHATKREDIVRVLFKGSVREARGIMPPGLPGHDEDLQGLSYDPDLARELLANSTYGGAEHLPPIVFTVARGSTSMAEALADMWAEVLGVEVEIQQVEWGSFLQDLNQGEYQAFSLGWSADYPDPQNFLDIQFHTGSAGNNTGYSDPRVDRLLEEARVEQDAAARFALYQQAEEIIISAAPWIPLFHGVDYVLVKPYVRDLVLTAQGMYYLEDAYVEPQ